MTFADLEAAVHARREPTTDAPTLARALWHDATGDWSAAHELAQSVDTADGAWVHAYLHRKEGDLQNAEYWYRRAGKPVATSALDDEWAAMVTLLLSRVDD
jgi:hypothetical protein